MIVHNDDLGRRRALSHTVRSSLDRYADLVRSPPPLFHPSRN
jgi:hypothetical protein